MKSFDHPSNEVTSKMRGTTDAAGHFYFLCPRCANNQVLQILDYKIERDGPVSYNPPMRHKAKRDFKIAFRVHCLDCKLTDTVELSNDGWQGGKSVDAFPFDGTPIYRTPNE
jgi:hypothetical protein